MGKFELETSIQFPFFKFNEIVTFSEVKKPSGVAYILLVLISESKNKNDNLANVLENFGVQKTLHYIFADVLQYLLNQEILENNFDFNKNNFDSYKIGDFNFTAYGKKIFAEESIPTGINKEIKLDVFYNIAMDELSLMMDSDLDPKPLMDCAISPEFMKRFTCGKDIEDYLNLNKGKDIPIKKEEVITKLVLVETENWVGKYDCVLQLDRDSVFIKFDNPLLQKFFDNNYSSAMVNKAISYKNKFQFKYSYAEKLKLNDYNSDKIIDILFPKDIDNVLKQKSKLIFAKDNYSSANSYFIKSSSSLENYDKNIEFVQVDMRNNVYAFIPGLFEFNNQVLGIITIPLVLKLKISFADLRQIVLPYLSRISSYSEENFKLLVQLTDITNDYDKAFEIMEGYLTDDIYENINLLNDIKPFALLNTDILKKYKQLLSDNYYKCIDSVTEDNLNSILEITFLIPKFLNIQSKEILERIFEKLSVKKPVETYETLVKRGFDKALVVLYVNPVPEALASKTAEDKSLLDLINYDSAMESLKKITGVFDYKKYLLNEEDINNSEFKKNFKSAFDLMKGIQVFKKANKELFDKYDGFMKIFNSVNDNINILVAATKNPNNIRPNLIEKKIASGEFQFVFINLSAKLESILNEDYDFVGSLMDMLTAAKKAGIISKETADDLHIFREIRNEYAHSKMMSDFTANDLRRWSKIIFDLEKKK